MTKQRDPAGGAPSPDGDILAELEAELAQDAADDRPPPGGVGYQLAGAVAGLTVGVVAAVLSYGYGLGTLREPGPGLWPFAIGVTIALLSAALLVVGRGLTDSERFTRSSWLPAFGLLTFVVLAVLMPLVGFEIPSLALCMVWLRFLGGESWRSTIVVSVCTVAAFYAVFLYALRIPLPHLI